MYNGSMLKSYYVIKLSRTKNLKGCFMRSKLWSIFLVVVGFIFIVSFSIAVPIWARPFYYAHIEPLEIEYESGFTREQIVEAFDEVMDYLNFGKPFGTGDLKYSEEGKSHFEDCKVLFDLDTWALIISFLLLVIAFLLAKFKILIPARLGKFGFWFYAGIVGLAIPIIVGVAIAVDFQNAFTVFHKIFFPGKENWVFSWYDDQIIRILPSQFFMNCGILIISILFTACATAIVLNIVRYRKNTKVLITPTEENQKTTE